MTRSNKRTMFLGMVLLLTVAACGSDGDQLSEEEFLAQANEICEVGSKALNETMEEAFDGLFSAGTEPTDEEFRQVLEENGQPILDAFVSNVRGQVDDIRDLNGPSDLEDELDPILDEASEILDRISDAGPVEWLMSDDDQLAGINPDLEAVGLTTCAESE